MGGFQLPNSRHIPHAMDKLDDRFADAFTQGVFADDIGICQREQQRRPQRIEIHTQHGEDFHHLNAAP